MSDALTDAAAVRSAAGGWSARVLVGTSYRWRRDAPAGDTLPPAWFRSYSREFPLLELVGTFDSLPLADTLAAWADAAPDGFQFDVQAFRLLCRRVVERSALPAQSFRVGAASRRVRLDELASEMQYEIWERFRLALEPLRRTGKLGCVIFRLPPHVQPDLEGGAYVESLCERLPEDRVALEVAGPAWRTSPGGGPPGGLPFDRMPIAFVRAGGADDDPGAWEPAPSASPLHVVRVPARARDLGAAAAAGRRPPSTRLDAWTARVAALVRREGPVHLIVPGRHRARAFASAMERGAAP